MNQNVLNFIKFSVDNNEFALSEAMFNQGVIVKENEDIVARLYKLFTRNRTKFIRIMRNAGFNKDAKNYTTEINTLVELAQSRAENIAGEKTSDVSREGVTTESGRMWYESVLDTLVGGGETTGTTTTVTEKPATGSQTTIIIVAIVAIGGIAALIYFLTK